MVGNRPACSYQERRAGRGDRDTVDALVTKLFATRPSKVRVSCRIADWLGGSDLAAFDPYFETSGGAVVLLLDILSEADQHLVLMAHKMSPQETNDFLRE